jgi:hypothetical protein
MATWILPADTLKPADIATTIVPFGEPDLTPRLAPPQPVRRTRAPSPAGDRPTRPPAKAPGDTAMTTPPGTTIHPEHAKHEATE